MMKTKTKTRNVTGGITVSNVTKNGRKITLAAVKAFTVPIELREVESSIGCGFRMEWISGTNDKEEFSLASGAGFGSGWMTFQYRGRNFCVQMTDVVTQFMAAIDASDSQ